MPFDVHGSDLALFVVVFGAFLVEAIVGFGSTVLTVTLGAQWQSVDVLLPAFVPLNMVLSTFLVWRGRKHVDLQLLGRRVLPFVGVGAAVGLLLTSLRTTTAVLAAFGSLVAGLAVVELMRSAKRTVPKPLPRVIGAVLLTVAGVVHGLFGAGGPLVVFVLGREIDDKTRFRSTLGVLWLVLNVALVVSFARAGSLNASSLRLSLWLAPALVLGALVGDRVHGLVDEARFRLIGQVLLLVAGAALVVRTLLHA